MRITFNKQTVHELLTNSENATERRPNLDQLFDPALRKDGKTPQLSGDSWPTEEDLKPNIIPAGLWLVGDQGVYLMSNETLTDNNKPTVTYANEINPHTLEFDDWYDAKQAAFGGDDGVVFLEAAALREWIRNTPGPTLSMNLTPRGLTLISAGERS